MDYDTATPFDLLLLAVFAAGCVFAGLAAWYGAVYPAVFVCAIMAILAVWSLIDTLRRGLRRATPFKRFEQRLLVRAISMVVAGGLVLGLGWQWLRTAASPWPPALIIFAIAAWLAAALLAVTRLRGKHESLGAYKRRVRYVEPAPPASVDQRKV